MFVICCENVLTLPLFLPLLKTGGSHFSAAGGGSAGPAASATGEGGTGESGSERSRGVGGSESVACCACNSSCLIITPEYQTVTSLEHDLMSL